jgi:hypothetical protein
MKKLIAIALVGAVVLSIGQFAYCGGHGGGGRGGGRGYGGCGRGGGGYHGGGWNNWNTFGAVCAGALGVGLIAAAVSDWDRPSYNYVSYPTYAAPAPYYPPVSYGAPYAYPPACGSYQQQVVTYQSSPVYYGYGQYPYCRQYGY